jgi:sugar phosphate isomerase/epimerase
MHIGLLTSPFGKDSFEYIVKFAAEAGFTRLEVRIGPPQHIDPGAVVRDGGSAVKKLLDQHKIGLSSLAVYLNTLDPDPRKRAEVGALLRSSVDAAKVLGVDVVCTLAGMPLPGKTKMQTIEQEAAGVFGPLCEYAGERGIKIALENWFATNIQHLGHWERLFQVVPAANFGLNFDPSHLYWQQIDYIGAVEQFGSRIFHTHAKDCEVKPHRLRKLGVLEMGWWRYVIPGFGSVDWGQYIGALRTVKFDGVLSIEHEDGAVGREFGFIKGREFLARFV